MKTFYLDTSTINRLYDNPRLPELRRAIKCKGKIILSIFNIVELASESIKERREGLLELSRDIGGNYRPLAMPNEILKRSVEVFRVLDKDMNYSMGYEGDGVWAILNKPELIDQEVYNQTIELKRKQEQWYQDLYGRGRSIWQGKISKLSKKERYCFTSNYSRFIKQYRPDFITNFVSDLASRGTSLAVDDELAKRLIKCSEHWRFFLSSMTYGMFVGSIRTINFGKSKTPGSIDIQQSIYLTNCDIFITADKAQYDMLRLINQFGHSKRQILKFDRFADWLLT